jgi:VanZ family protein
VSTRTLSWSAPWVEPAIWLVALACLALTVTFSILRPPQPPAVVPASDKFLHFGAYFTTTLAFLLASVWRPGRGAGRWPKAGFAIVAAAIVLGVAMELVQSTIGRDAEVLDVVADAAGALAACAAWTLVRRKFS